MDNFEKYGFEKPDFECEIWKQVGNQIFGYAPSIVSGEIEPTAWDLNGINILEYYNLTPLKPSWENTNENQETIADIIDSLKYLNIEDDEKAVEKIGTFLEYFENIKTPF